VSGFHVDPGYSGKLIFAVFNASPLPIAISDGAPLFKIWFANMDQKSSEKFIYSGPSITDISDELVNNMSKEIFPCRR
jgi:dCTP deaminase